jgi:hypothetical protein
MKATLAMSAAMVGHETSTGENILNWWGGGIEIAGLSKGRFEKLTSVLHTVWKARLNVSTGYEICLVPKLTKYDYVDGALIAQTFEFSGANNAGAVMTERSYGICTPLLRSASEYRIETFLRPDFSHRTLCCYLIFEPPHADGSWVRAYHSASGDTPLRLADSDTDRVVFSFRGDLIRDLETGVSNATSRPARFSGIGY